MTTAEMIKNSLLKGDTNPELEQLTQEVSDMVSKGQITLKEAFGMPQDKMDMMYSLAHDLYENDKYEKASKIFNTLCVYDPLKLDYWLGLAACQKLLEQYESAVMAYHSILSIDPTHFVSYFEMAGCLYKLKQFPAAKKFLDAMISMANEGDIVPKNDRNRAVLQKAKVMMTLLESVS